MKDDAVIKDNEAVYLINEQTYLHLRENIEGIGYEVFEKESPLPVEEGQIPREVLGDSQRRIEAAREYYLAEHFDDPVVKIQNVAVTTLEKFRSGVRKRRNLDPHSLPDDDVRFIDPRYNELFRVPDGSMVQLKFPNREAERGGHYYRQRTCAVCGHSYWPTHSQQEFCSDECRRINHNRKTLEFYHKKKGNLKPDPEATPTPKPKEDNAA